MYANHRFYEEVDALSHLAHPSILRVYGICHSPVGDLFTVWLVSEMHISARIILNAPALLFFCSFTHCPDCRSWNFAAVATS